MPLLIFGLTFTLKYLAHKTQAPLSKGHLGVCDRPPLNRSFTAAAI